MPKFKIIKKDTIKYEGLFDLNQFFNLTYDFFDKRGYDINNPIQIIKQSTKQNGVVPIIVELKLNDYFKIIGKITIIYDISKVNVKKSKNTKSSNKKSPNNKSQNNEELKLEEGKITISIETSLEHDYDNKFKSYNIFGEVIRTVIENFLMKDTVNNAKEKINNDFEQYKIELLRFFNLKAINKVM